MKQFFLFTSIILFSELLNAQSKFEYGITGEGSWIIQSELITTGRYDGELDNWSAGGGFYASYPIWWRFSLLGGARFRYAKIQRGFEIWETIEGEQWDQMTGFNIIAYDRFYLVVPLDLRLHITPKLFISCGIEACRMLNDHDYIKHATEYNRNFGIGGYCGKLSWNLQYLLGFKEQSIENYYSDTVIPDDLEIPEEFYQYYLGSKNSHKSYDYKTKRVQLCLSYPLWSKK